METPRNRAPLTAQQRHYLRTEIDRAVRSRTTPAPSRYACPECGTDTRERTSSVVGCETCYERIWRRKRRTNAA